MEVKQLMPWANERHNFYCDKAYFFLESLGIKFEHPTPLYIAKGVNRAGRAHLKECECEYSLVYLISVKEDYEQTIAHEVAHHVVWQLDPNTSTHYAYHGDMFRFVMTAIFSRPPSTRHSYGYDDAHVVLAKVLLALKELETVK